MKPGTLVLTTEKCLVFLESPPEETQMTLFNMMTKKIDKGQIGFVIKELDEENPDSEWVCVSIGSNRPVEILKKNLITLDEFLIGLKNEHQR
jgi:hypothetical protein